jgi:hypothetical protein
MFRASSRKRFQRFLLWIEACILDVLREDAAKGIAYYRRRIENVKDRLACAEGRKEIRKYLRTLETLRPRLTRMKNWHATLAR